MIKNTLIVILSLIVIGLSWMNISSLRNKQELDKDFYQKKLEVKKQIHDIYNTLYQQDNAKRNSVQDVPDVKYQEDTTHKIVTTKESNIKKNIILRPEKNQPPTQTITDILNEDKKKPDNNWMNTKELESILSHLKSAQKLLRKTSFTFTGKPVDTAPQKVKPEKITIKKKLFGGPEKSG